MKRVLLPLLLVIATAAHAKNCPVVDDDNEPAVIVSGRLTAHHAVPPGDLRAPAGPFLVLDTPLPVAGAAVGADQCFKWRRIAVVSSNDDPRLTKWVNQRVVITGRLRRFISAWFDPQMYLEVETIRKGSPR
jgi:hypothetical protein